MSVGETYYRFETVNGCLTITLLPELNDKQWADIERVGTEIVDRISAAPSPKVLVDLTSLSYMGSAMVALIVRLYKTVNSRGGKMVVVNQHELVFEVLKLAGLTKLWTIVGTRAEAFSSMGVKATPVSSVEPAACKRAAWGSWLRVSSAPWARSWDWPCNFRSSPHGSAENRALDRNRFCVCRFGGRDVPAESGRGPAQPGNCLLGDLRTGRVGRNRRGSSRGGCEGARGRSQLEECAG